MTKTKAVALVGDVIISPEDRLAGIADDIRAEWGRGNEAAFAIGRLLGEARNTFPSDIEYGRWVEAQQFPFSRQTAYRLRWASEHEPEVRAYIADPAVGHKADLGVSTAVDRMTAKPKPPSAEVIPVTDATPADPAYASLRSAYRAIVGTDETPTNAFLTMHVDDLAKCASFIMGLAEAYKAAKSARTGA